MALAGGISEKRATEGKAGDFAADAAAFAHGPGFGGVKGEAGDDPAEAVAEGFEDGAEGFGFRVGHGGLRTQESRNGGSTGNGKKMEFEWKVGAAGGEEWARERILWVGGRIGGGMALGKKAAG